MEKSPEKSKIIQEEERKNRSRKNFAKKTFTINAYHSRAVKNQPAGLQKHHKKIIYNMFEIPIFFEPPRAGTQAPHSTAIGITLRYRCNWFSMLPQVPAIFLFNDLFGFAILHI